MTFQHIPFVSNLPSSPLSSRKATHLHTQVSKTSLQSPNLWENMPMPFPADIFTKPLAKHLFTQFCKKLGLLPHPIHLSKWKGREARAMDLTRRGAKMNRSRRNWWYPSYADDAMGAAISVPGTRRSIHTSPTPFR
ncbi:hypothetical protein PIIN_08974 [Serendipita indica DSM 11827]|uniref:Uncharacterized protein n=1 Tax=Serendipita indica (strain DSM 11827) TaxID=1109443 RepID=G4U2B7_SERID|nr:hypothetical protein PIIN_08974 [Serendipita indica DSM 11827]